MSVRTEVERATGVEQGRRESVTEYLKRVVKALDDLPEKSYNKLSKDAQDWAEEATQAFNADPNDVPDFPEEDQDDEPKGHTRRTARDEDEEVEEAQSEEDDAEPDETTETEDEDMETQTNETPRRGASRKAPPPSKKVAAKVAPTKKAVNRGDGKSGGALMLARSLLCRNPDMNVADLADKVKAKGFTVSTQTLHTMRSGFRQDVRALQAAGLLKRSLI